VFDVNSFYTQDDEDSGKNDGGKADDDDTDDDDENDDNEDDGDVSNHGQHEMEQLERLVPDSPLVQLEKYFRNAKRYTVLY
jgi:hypothetical protein